MSKKAPRTQKVAKTTQVLPPSKRPDNHRPLAELNVIDDFLFRTLLMREDSQEEVALLLLNSLLNRKIRHVTVQVQREFVGLDQEYHGARMDLIINDNDDEATLYDIEPDNNIGEVKSLPRRNRFYSAIIDANDLRSGQTYDKARNIVIIMILSYDPFGKGDMYYEAGTALKTHPEIPYDDGIRRIYLYTDGRNNVEGEAGKRMESMVRYIRHSDAKHAVDKDTKKLDRIVRRVRANKEVTMVYLREIEREKAIVREVEQRYGGTIAELEIASQEKDARIAEMTVALEAKDATIADMAAENALLKAQLAARQA